MIPGNTLRRAAAMLGAGVFCLAQPAFAISVDGDPSNETYFEDFTGFNGSMTDPGSFTIPTAAGDVLLSGSTAGVGHFTTGVTFLYRSGTEAWIAEPRVVLTVSFPIAMAVVEFYAATVDPAQINVFGMLNEPASINLNSNGSGIFSFSGAITGFTLSNLSMDPDLDICSAYCASIDDLGFSPAPVPLPAAAWLMLSGLMGLGMFARNRASRSRG